MLTIKDLKRCATAKLAINPTNLALAHEALNQLWSERLEDRGYEKLPGRGGSCKFAALLARELFGGQLDGNLDHVFVRKDQVVFDLNHQEEDVLILGACAHISTPWVLHHSDYRASLGSCIPRVLRWAQWVLQHPEAQLVALEPQEEDSASKNESTGLLVNEMGGP